MDEMKQAESLQTTDRKNAYFAKRFAGKEACLKALGTGMRTGLAWHDMSIGNDDLGRPILELSGGVAEKLKSLGQNPRVHITLSDEAGLAKATVILESV